MPKLPFLENGKFKKTGSHKQFNQSLGTVKK